MAGSSLGIKGLLADLVEFVFPETCPFCTAVLSERSEPGAALCRSCAKKAPYLPTLQCALCGKPFPAPDESFPEGAVCGPCGRKAPPFDIARSVCVHDGPASRAVASLKYHGNTSLARPLGRIMAERLTVPCRRAEVIVPVPLHRTRLALRGYNQSLLLGRSLSRAWGLPIDGTAVARTRNTKPQTSLTHAKRKVNVRGAFRAKAKRLEGRRVLLVDDVFTTGSTVAECARALKRDAGAAWVAVATFTRSVEI